LYSNQIRPQEKLKKKNTTHVQYPERKLHKNKKNKKAKTRQGEFFFKTTTRSTTTTTTQLSHRNQKENKLPTKSFILELNQPAGFPQINHAKKESRQKLGAGK
jgi:hypothetical protein